MVGFNEIEETALSILTERSGRARYRGVTWNSAVAMGHGRCPACGDYFVGYEEVIEHGRYHLRKIGFDENAFASMGHPCRTCC